MLNGLGSQLDPETNIIEIAAPYARSFIREEQLSASALLGQAVLSGRAALKLPQLLSEFFVSTGRGETRVEITSRTRRKRVHLRDTHLRPRADLRLSAHQ
jgi:predicted unusual protein kinase regulating ubiquinone biosynthesis (AarF/ABC1/UbiB family)